MQPNTNRVDFVRLSLFAMFCLRRWISRCFRSDIAPCLAFGGRSLVSPCPTDFGIAPSHIRGLPQERETGKQAAPIRIPLEKGRAGQGRAGLVFPFFRPKPLWFVAPYSQKYGDTCQWCWRHHGSVINVAIAHGEKQPLLDLAFSLVEKQDSP